MNNENLIPIGDRSESEQREMRQKGGKASGKKRRDKRTFRETIMSLLSMPDVDKNGKQLISPITGKPMSVLENTVLQLLIEARKGNVKAIQTILDVLGERTFHIESDVKIGSRYDNMTEEEMREEANRLLASINDP